MHFFKDGQWQESREVIELFQDGAVARNGPHQVIFAPNLATPGAIDLQTPEGYRIRTHVLGLAFFDAATGNSELVADVKDCLGELHPPNVVIYPDAFNGVRGTVRFTYSRDRFEQDVILFERLALPAGFNAASSTLEIWTEAVEAPAPVVTAGVVGNLPDQTLIFSSMRIGSGRAFALEDPQGAQWSAPMAKTWTVAGGRTFLIEAVEFQAVQAQLNALPDPPQGAALKPGAAARQLAKNAAGQRLFPRRQQAAKAGGKIQMAFIEEKGSKIATNAAVTPPSPTNRQLAIGNRKSERGLVLDYSLVTTLTNFIFKGDTTWFVSGNYTLSGTNILEGGAVLKYTNGVTLTFNGPIDCRTGPYSPAIFTSWCDDTLGEAIAGSTGNPWTNYAAGTAIYFGSGVTGQLSHVRISHADTAITFYGGYEHEAQHLQVVHCLYAFKPYYAAFRLRNGLLVNTDTIIDGSLTSTCRTEHATFNIVRQLNLAGSSAVFLTNSLLVAVTNAGTYSGANNASNSDPAAVFQTVGAGTAYLLDNTYRNVGTTNISPTLLSEIRKRTTYPPVELDSWITTDTTLSPQAQRDTDQIDLGWHYAPLDYVAGGVQITNATLTLTAGTALGCRGRPDNVPADYFAVTVLNGGQFKSLGSPDNLNRIVRYNIVQEQANTDWTGFFVPSVYSSWSTGDPSSGTFRFTQWSVPAKDTHHFYGWYDVGNMWEFAHCQFQGGRFASERPIVNATNCLFQRVSTGFWGSSGFSEYTNLRPTFRSCLFRGGSLDLYHTATEDAWTFKDNLFDQTTITTNGSFTANYNAYTTNVTRIPPHGANDILLATSNLVYESGVLGRFYLPTNSLLINAGSTYATNVGLHQFTTTTNQVVETNTVLDISFHWIGLNSPFVTGLPLDADGDGIADYLEDLNGNGVYDAALGETDWKTYNSKLGIGPGPGLITFTPLK
jgi:hypothetical protein